MKKQKIQFKTISDLDVKLNNVDGVIYIEGYANTKNKPDSYGDIPTNFNNEPVYDFKRYKNNPVLLVDHNNSAGFIAGTMTDFYEDETGLKFKARLRPVDEIHNPITKDAVQAFITGYGRALSIGGHWIFGDKQNPSHLTKAHIHEVSLVAIGADGNALTRTPHPKSFGEISEGSFIRLEIENLIGKYREEPSDELIKKIKQLQEYQKCL